VQEAFAQITGARQAAASTPEAWKDSSWWPNSWAEIIGPSTLGLTPGVTGAGRVRRQNPAGKVAPVVHHEAMNGPRPPTGVGLTAVAGAGFRAQETARPDALFHDPWAAHFVAAAGLPSDLGRDRLPSAELEHHWDRMAVHMVIRTRFFDQYLLDAATAGIRQVVVLAAGLDTRALRLPWTTAPRLWELDLPSMTDFKEQVLADAAATAVCDRRVVPADLRLDWPEALRQAGHRADLPTAWLAEGLLMYLAPQENDRLLDRITDLSAPGSRLGLSAASPSILDSPLTRVALDVFGDPALDVRSLWRSGFEEPPRGWLESRGWRSQVYDTTHCAETYGRPLPAPSPDEAAAGTEWLLTATRD
jgi:methyltransferase (TIGR00027 family)